MNLKIASENASLLQYENPGAETSLLCQDIDADVCLQVIFRKLSTIRLISKHIGLEVI
jgi:hypothetical protein